MATLQQHVDAPPEQVFGVLANGWFYSSWVVGAAHIRAVDATWPAPGSRIHHSVGPWPMHIHDVTRVLAADPPRSLTLEARAWPLGQARVTVTVEPREAGALVTMAESPVSGPARWLHNRLTEGVLRARNAESLLRLRHLAEGGAR